MNDLIDIRSCSTKIWQSDSGYLPSSQSINMKAFSWFTELFGFEETSRAKFVLSEFQRKFELLSDGQTLRSVTNDRVFQCGTFSTPTVESLRSSVLNRITSSKARIDLSLHHPVTGDALELHSAFPLASFQAASQFNCLEFQSYHVTPEDGITSYSTDRTQGPACALACPAGTLFRNYYAPVLDPVNSHTLQVGQSKDKQINNLDLVELAIGNTENNYISVLNGYTFSPSTEKLTSLNELLQCKHAHNNYRNLIDLVKVGWQQDTEVTYEARFREVTGEKVLCSQMYCSALSVAYSGISIQTVCYCLFIHILV
ncbi:hypothetical protein EON65_23605 [archaeon]|nr:MAG: hypothetical protein EON65_23605 [archaeon]